MAGYNTDVWASLEPWSKRAFLAAGLVWIIDTVPYVLDLFVDFSIPDAVAGTLLLSPFLLTVAGLLGLYGPLANETPRLAIGGTLLVAVAGIVDLVTIGWVVNAGLLGQPTPPAIALALIVIASILALLFFGAASVRTNTPSRRCGVLLLTLAGTLGVWMGTALLVAMPEWTPVVFGFTFAVITLAIGYVRHTSAASIDLQRPSSAPTTR